MEINAVIGEFKEYLERFMAMQYASVLFHWDQSTGAPKGGVANRAKVMGLIGAEAFGMAVSDKMKYFLDAFAENTDKLDAVTLAMYKKCKRDYDKMSKVPPEEYRRYSETVAVSEHYWEEAKSKSDFSIFAPYLKKVIDFNKQFIGYRGFKAHPYNTLLDDYEPDTTIAAMDAFFSTIKASVVPLLKRITDSGVHIPDEFLNKRVSKENQARISDILMNKLKFDKNRGMLKESEHPFTTDFGKNDVRITTHYYENAFLSSLYSVIHECGHAIYEQNTADEIACTILDSGVSMGIHESQSRFYENIIGRSREFWENILPEIKEYLGEAGVGLGANDIYRAANIAKPSLIRIEADELTYPLHIMVRYEIEKMIFSGDVDVNDLPGIWNDKYEEYLGIRPDRDSTGILQDVHWSGGMFGYFPSYAIGSAFAAQLLNRMNKDINLYGLVREGNYTDINKWLKDKIHIHGSMKTPAELITDICGEGLNSKYYTDYLTDKYIEVYGLK